MKKSLCGLNSTLDTTKISVHLETGQLKINQKETEQNQK